MALLRAPDLGPTGMAYALASAVLHVAYFLSLQRGYEHGDLSVVYPVARGTGPVLATVAAVALLGERPSPVAVAGAALVALGVFALARPEGASAVPDTQGRRLRAADRRPDRRLHHLRQAGRRRVRRPARGPAVGHQRGALVAAGPLGDPAPGRGPAAVGGEPA